MKILKKEAIQGCREMSYCQAQDHCCVTSSYHLQIQPPGLPVLGTLPQVSHQTWGSAHTAPGFRPALVQCDTWKHWEGGPTATSTVPRLIQVVLIRMWNVSHRCVFECLVPSCWWCFRRLCNTSQELKAGLISWLLWCYTGHPQPPVTPVTR